MKEITTESLIAALDSVIRYNCNGWEIREWLDFEKKPGAGHYIYYPIDKYSQRSETEEIIWMICVLLFGNYGVSPRSGWIEDVEGFKDFIRKITETTATADLHED